MLFLIQYFNYFNQVTNLLFYLQLQLQLTVSSNESFIIKDQTTLSISLKENFVKNYILKKEPEEARKRLIKINMFSSF